MNHPTLGLLEKLRPPTGFRTEAALGATYSADLLTCMAVLTTLDGGDGEQVRYGRIEAYRALDRLRDKVRICYQAGRISPRDGTKYPSLTLLDRILLPVRVAGRGSFHPKVWIVRQSDNEKRDRFVLVVSSRNITTSADWDLGIALDGSLSGKGVSLPRVRELAKHALARAGDPDRLESLGDLDAVRWQLPPGVREIEFDFQEGGSDAGHLHRLWRVLPARASRVLLLSPFLDGRMINEAATRFRNAHTRRLVAGTNDLVSVALGTSRASLLSLQPRQVAPAEEAPNQPEIEGAEGEDERESTRALHAKVIAVDDERRATIVLGSNNLTSMGWCGGSTEAFVRLVGDVSLCEPLWDWAGKHAREFDVPEEGVVPEPPLLERLKDELHRVAFRLEDQPAGPSRLVAESPIALPEDVRMDVARYTTPLDVVAFPSGRNEVEIPACSTVLRTRFVVCTLHHRNDQASWIAMAELDPPIDDSRDRELVAKLLGLREFLAYLQSLNDEESIPGTIEGEDEDPDPRGPRRVEGEQFEDVHLEGLLRRLVTNSNGFAEMDRAIERYGALIEKRQLPPEELVLLGELLAAWTAIREGFR